MKIFFNWLMVSLIVVFLFSYNFTNDGMPYYWEGNFENTHISDNWQINYHAREPLSEGKYYVEFEQEINFARYDNLPKKFRIDFEVR